MAPVVPTRFAHSVPGEPEHRWEPLPEHLERVGVTAARFAAKFGAEQMALAAGLLHDIGKNSDAFQAYIRDDGNSPDHSTAGAIEAVRRFPGPVGRLIALVVAGHHAGLSDGEALDARLQREIPGYAGWEALVPRLPPQATPALRDGVTDLSYTLAFFGRMLFSCLVDADFIETDAFYAAAAGETRERGGHAPLSALRDRLDVHLASFAGRPGPLNARRAEILAHARAKSALPPGLFTMTVPTGGGKTLAGLAFALDHAVRHGLDRVIYIIPYAGAWIETGRLHGTRRPSESPPARGRGSKRPSRHRCKRLASRLPRGGVDRNYYSAEDAEQLRVASRAGAWIDSFGSWAARPRACSTGLKSGL